MTSQSISMLSVTLKVLLCSPWIGSHRLALWSFIQKMNKAAGTSKCRGMSVGYVLWLRASFFELPSPVPPHCLSTRLPFCRIVLPLRGGSSNPVPCGDFTACSQSAIKTKGMPPPAGIHGNTSVTSANRAETHKGQLSAAKSEPSKIATRNQSRAAVPRRWTRNSQENFKNNRGQLPLALYGHESEYARPSCPPCIQEWKLFH